MGYSVWGSKRRKGSPKVRPDGYRRRCRACKDRWAQTGDLCASCRTAGHTDSFDTQRRRMLERQAREDALRRREAPPRVNPIIVVEGTEYEVVWDGRV